MIKDINENNVYILNSNKKNGKNKKFTKRGMFLHFLTLALGKVIKILFDTDLKRMSEEVVRKSINPN